MAQPESSPLAWRKSTRSLNTDCVEVATTRTTVWVRDSKDPDGVRLSFAADRWADFIGAVRGGEFDLPMTAVAADDNETG